MRSIRLAVLLALAPGCAPPPAADARGPFLAGAAAVDITPPAGWRRAGGYEEEFSRGVHDPLFVKALVLEQDGRRAALVIADLCGVSREVSDPARRLVEERSGIPAASVTFCATHSHGGPEYTGVLWEAWRERAVRNHGQDPHAPGGDYAARLVRAVAEAVALADARKRPARVESGMGRLPGIAFNRRFHMKDGSVRFNPGKRNPDILRPAGPVDEALPHVLFRGAADGAPLASLTVFALHTAVFGGPRFGADFPGVLQERLRERHGPEFVSLFFEGCAGDVNHIDVSNGIPQAGEAERLRIGRAMADAVLAAPLAPEQPGLALASARAALPLRETGPDEEAWARDVIAGERSAKAPFMTKVDAYRVLWARKLRARSGATSPAEVQAFRISADTALVTLPHEIFVELGLEIRRRSPFPRTLVVSLANDIDFYVPTRKAFGEGSYEVSTSPYLPGCGETLVEAAVGLLVQLRR